MKTDVLLEHTSKISHNIEFSTDLWKNFERVFLLFPRTFILPNLMLNIKLNFIVTSPHLTPLGVLVQNVMSLKQQPS